MNNVCHIYISQSTDPYVNLAIENKLLLNIKPSDKILFFYKNDKSVVYGRFQNPWSELDLNYLKSQNIKTVRRQSGGGCVYQDLGNLNYSFIHGDRDFKKEDNHKIIIEALAKLNIKAYASGRSDILLKHDAKEYKISGSAFKQKKDRSFHHGTLLINANKEDLKKSLQSKYEITATKSIPSNPMSTINLEAINSNITEEKLIKKISESFCKYWNIEPKGFEYISEYDEEYLNELKDNKWIWGETPLFTINIDQNSLTIKKGILIESLGPVAMDELYGKSLYDLNLESLNSKQAKIIKKLFPLT